MNKINFYLVFFLLTFSVFPDELTVARDYINNNNLLSNYMILNLNLRKDNTNTYLFYKPYNNRVLNTKDKTLAFTDAVLIKASSKRVIQFLAIYKNGLVKTNDNITFYDFTKASAIIFNGWLLETGNMVFDEIKMNVINLQLTNDGIDRIPADPPLADIFWDYKNNYPVKYEFYRYPLPRAAYLIEYENEEDIKIKVARTGLRHDNLMLYLDTLSDYDKKIIINTMFALYGYEFKTGEWRTYFSKYLWYKSDSSVVNSVDLLDEYQKKLFEYLTK